MKLITYVKKQYVVHIEKEAYTPIDEPVQPKIGDTLRVSYTEQAVKAATTTAPLREKPGGQPLQLR